MTMLTRCYDLLIDQRNMAFVVRLLEHPKGEWLNVQATVEQLGLEVRKHRPPSLRLRRNKIFALWTDLPVEDEDGEFFFVLFHDVERGRQASAIFNRAVLPGGRSSERDAADYHASTTR